MPIMFTKQNLHGSYGKFKIPIKNDLISSNLEVIGCFIKIKIL